MSDPILDLSTLIQRPTIRVDGKAYELRSPEELSVLEGQFLAQAGRRINEIAEAGDPDRALQPLLTDVVSRVVIGLPDTVLGALSEAHLISICEVFTGLLLRRRLVVAGAIAKRLTAGATTSPSTGAKSFQGSSASLEAAPSPGSTRSPSPS
jgi:hypothetical protein